MQTRTHTRIHTQPHIRICIYVFVYVYAWVRGCVGVRACVQCTDVFLQVTNQRPINTKVKCLFSIPSVLFLEEQEISRR